MTNSSLSVYFRKQENSSLSGLLVLLLLGDNLEIRSDRDVTRKENYKLKPSCVQEQNPKHE
jgi:hypothetical protein